MKLENDVLDFVVKRVCALSNVKSQNYDWQGILRSVLSIPSNMPLKECQSSNVSGYGYDAESRVLAVRFAGGLTYLYMAVPPETVKALDEAPSKGVAINTYVKAKGFIFIKLGE